MKIVLFKYADEINRIRKNLTNGLEISGILNEDCNVINPVIKLGYNSNLFNYNYAYIEDFHRYYFIDNITLSNKNIIVSMHVDVLKTYESDILNSKAFITRSNVGNNYIADNLARTLSQTKFVVRNLGTGFTKAVSYVMLKGK